MDSKDLQESTSASTVSTLERFTICESVVVTNSESSFTLASSDYGEKPGKMGIEISRAVSGHFTTDSKTSAEIHASELKIQLLESEKVLTATKTRADDLEAKFTAQYDIYQTELEALRETLKTENAATIWELQEQVKEARDGQDKAKKELRKERKKYLIIESKLKEQTKQAGVDKQTLEAVLAENLQYANDIEQLNADLEDAALKSDGLQKSLEIAQKLEAEIRKQRIELQQEIDKLKQTAREQSIQKQNIECEDELKHLRLRNHLATLLNNSNAKRDSLQSEIEQLRDNISIVKRDAANSEAKIVRQAREITRLLEQVSSLKQENEDHGPLLRVAADVRLRFLETVREVNANVPRHLLNAGIIEDGNIAAHRANGEVDSALFVFDLVPEDYVENGAAIFENLYGIAPEDYDDLPFHVQRLKDCEVTLLSMRPNDHSREMREEHRDLIQELRLLYRRLDRQRRSVDEHEGAERLLTELENLTDEIVQAEKRNNRRRR